MWSTGGAYNGWVEYLERWGCGEDPDDSQLPRLAAADFHGDTWQRLGARLTEAVSERLQSWSAALSRAVGESRDEFSVGRALAQSRVGLRSVRRLASHPALEPELRDAIARLVDEQVVDAQRMLEEQVDRMRRDGADASRVEARRRTIRENPLTAVIVEQAHSPATRPADTGWLTDPGARPSRRVIVD